MLAYLVASGRAGAYFHLFGAATRGTMEPQAFDDAFVTGLLWIAALAPLTFAAWEIGRTHTAARRLGFELLVGFKEVCRRAFLAESASDTVRRDEAFARPLRDNPRAAAAWGAAVTLLVPTFFASFIPDLRSPAALAWLGVTGLLMGLGTYCRLRAMAYLHDEPGRWDLFREWRLLNPARYDQGGRVFVRWQAVIALVIPVWWLGGGAAILFRS